MAKRVPKPSTQIRKLVKEFQQEEAAKSIEKKSAAVKKRVETRAANDAKNPLATAIRKMTAAEKRAATLAKRKAADPVGEYRKSQAIGVKAAATRKANAAARREKEKLENVASAKRFQEAMAKRRKALHKKKTRGE